ncbi:hypothetical protein ScPMuIL_000697 [Solemya velum]
MSALTVEFSEAESAARGYRRLSSLFRPQMTDAKKCFRCKTNVYHAERLGPVHEVVFHRNCFKCCICGQFLTIKNYWSNQLEADDKEIYCQTHAPRVGAAKIDAGAVGIRRNIDVQKGFRELSKKLNTEIRFPGTFRAPHVESDSIAIQRALTAPKTHDHGEHVGKTGHIGMDALQITGPIDAQVLQRPYQRKLDKHHYPPNIFKRKKLIEAQKRLEEEHRKEEDRLFQEFQNDWHSAKNQLGEIDNEWEVKLKELTSRYEKEFQRKGKKDRDQGKIMTVQYEKQKQDLEKNMTLKRLRTKDHLSMRIREKEQEMTSTMVQRQSKQMLELIAAKQDEIKKELTKELEAKVKSPDIGKPVTNGGTTVETNELIEELTALEMHDIKQLPPPYPPSCRKKDLYTDTKVFKELDEHVIKVAENDQLTYTDLVQQLTENMFTDLEKVRAIYRWITVKDLNVMEFDESMAIDTPLCLLRGIKFGTETYHVLFMRLCSYVGIHCKEIKGHSKSVGYEPGMQIKENSFQNTWNAVFVDGDWRLVQCNWGARHLVLNKDDRKDSTPKSKDQIRYQYDEHYFLTDPDEFIQEFWPFEEEWQLLENPITLEQFEKLPFVRSVFFHFGMRFERSGMPAVIETNEKGGADIKIKVPEDLENELVFYYQMRFAGKEKRNETTYRGANLERFVYQTMVDNTIMFSIHVPVTGEFFFEVFANKMDETFKTVDDFPPTSPFRLKCACKFKIVCSTLEGKMHPLPDCASGEWGPKKAWRHFKLKPRVSTANTDASDTSSDTGSTGSGEHPDNPKAGIINVDESVELKFKCPKPLQFVAKLKMNFVEDKALEPFYNVSVEDTTLIIYISPPQLGQYGLDIYAKSKDALDSSTLSHACKYLLNSVSCSSPVEIPIKPPPRSDSMKEKWGPSPVFEELGMKTLSHGDSTIYCIDTNQCTVEIEIPENVEVSFQYMREPDEDSKELVTLTMQEKDKKTAKFSIAMKKLGNYMLAIYARDTSSEKISMTNVYNYLICYRKTGNENGTKSKSIIKDKEPERKKSIFSIKKSTK